jgi:hypothetical protein
MTRILLILVTVLVIASMMACSSGPPSPKPGSPGFFWAVARESYRTGDMVKTDAALLELTHGASEFAAKARVWHLIMSAGLSQGFSELADAYDAGARMNLTSPVYFRNQAAALRSRAAEAALQFTQALYETVECDEEGKVHLAFSFPGGGATQPEALGKISLGVRLSDMERDSLQMAMLQRGVLLTAARAVGGPDDPAKAMAIFQSPDARVPHNTFVFEMAKLLYEESDLFGAQRMDRPNRQITMCDEARITLQSLPESPDTKQLIEKIEKKLKELRGE